MGRDRTEYIFPGEEESEKDAVFHASRYRRVDAALRSQRLALLRLWNLWRFRANAIYWEFCSFAARIQSLLAKTLDEYDSPMGPRWTPKQRHLRKKCSLAYSADILDSASAANPWVLSSLDVQLILYGWDKAIEFFARLSPSDREALGTEYRVDNNLSCDNSDLCNIYWQRESK